MNEKLIITIVLFAYFAPVIHQLILLLRDNKDESKEILRRLLRFTKYSFIVLIFTTVIFGILSHTNFLNYESPLTFDKYEKITFKNFRGIEFFKKSLYGNERFAYVVTTIESDIDDKNVTLESFFHPSRSFVYNKNTFNTELLSHEKYHFKITELYVRKAKKRISNLTQFNEDEIQNIIDQTKKQERDFQIKYDFDTFHSYVLREQKKYEKEIDSLLNSLNQYKDPKIKIDDKN